MAEKKRVWLTTRQIGIVATLGGLGFAYCALGLYIPIVPPFIVDIREPLAAVIGMAAGPWGALIGGFLMGVSGTTPVVGCPYYMALGLFFAAFSKKIWGLKSWAGRIALTTAAILAINVFVLTPILVVGMYLVYGLTLWDWLVIIWGVAIVPMYIVEEIVVVLVAMKFAPSFMEPRWLWSGGEKVTS